MLDKTDLKILKLLKANSKIQLRDIDNKKR